MASVGRLEVPLVSKYADAAFHALRLRPSRATFGIGQDGTM
jgi:hypothetical protein